MQQRMVLVLALGTVGLLTLAGCPDTGPGAQRAEILAPLYGATLTEGDLHIFRARVFFSEPGFVGRYEWRSSLEAQPLGDELAVANRDLEPGEHVITFTAQATDAVTSAFVGTPASVSMPVTVVPALR